MDVMAKHRYLRVSPQKVRLVLEPVRGLPAEQAVAYLRLAKQASARPVEKLIQSALANAEHNHSLDPKRMIVSRLTADGGPSLKRWQAASRGRAAMMKRRSSHLTVVLTEGPEAPGPSLKEKVAKRVPKPAGKRGAKPKEDPTKASATPAGQDVPKKEAKPDPNQLSKQPDVAKTEAVEQAAPRKTQQQTGRGATTRGAHRTPGQSGKGSS